MEVYKLEGLLKFKKQLINGQGNDVNRIFWANQLSKRFPDVIEYNEKYQAKEIEFMGKRYVLKEEEKNPFEEYENNGMIIDVCGVVIEKVSKEELVNKLLYLETGKIKINFTNTIKENLDKMIKSEKTTFSIIIKGKLVLHTTFMNINGLYRFFEKIDNGEYKIEWLKHLEYSLETQ